MAAPAAAQFDFTSRALTDTSWADERAGVLAFTVPDGSMAPDHAQGASLTLTPADSISAIGVGTTVLLTQGGQRVLRQVVALPGHKELEADPAYLHCTDSKWAFFSVVEDTVIFFRDEHPPEGTTLAAVSDLTSYDDISEVTLKLSEWDAAPVIGDSLFMVHALTRATLADPDAARTHAQGADSREWGAIHFNDLVGYLDE